MPTSSATGRVEGYRHALEQASVAVDLDLIIPSTFGIQSGAEAVGKLMNLSRRPTAVFAVNDNTAIGALSALSKMGISVPNDVSLVGYNDIPIVSHLRTLRVPFDQIAANALDLHTHTAVLHDNRILVSAPTLIPRKSTARLGE